MLNSVSTQCVKIGILLMIVFGINWSCQQQSTILTEKMQEYILEVQTLIRENNNRMIGKLEKSKRSMNRKTYNVMVRNY